jgi:hypothetical protein
MVEELHTVNVTNIIQTTSKTLIDTLDGNKIGTTKPSHTNIFRVGDCNQIVP